MSVPSRIGMTASCACGSVELTAIGTPIVSNVCYCGDCQQGSLQIEALSNAGPVRDPDGGTAYMLYRRDRIECLYEVQIPRRSSSRRRAEPSGLSSEARRKAPRFWSGNVAAPMSPDYRGNAMTASSPEPR